MDAGKLASWLWLGALFVSCTSASFTARVWRSTPEAPHFPEQACLERHESCAFYQDVQHLAARDVGVAFSGGGARAASAALGQLRALHALRIGEERRAWPETPAADWCRSSASDRWIDRVRYISAVSGGAWTSTAYTFLPDEFDDCEFLGKPRTPSQLAWQELERENGLMELAIGRGSRFEHLFGRYLRRAGHEAWGRAIADTFLTELHLNQQRAWFAAGAQSRTDIIENDRLRWWRLDADQNPQRFIKIPRAARPFLIANATILSNDKLGDNGDADLYPLEITPLYAGSSGRGNPVGKETHQFGGGYIDTFALDATALKVGPAYDVAEGQISDVAHRFTISDLMGATSSAVVETIARRLPLISSNELGFAHYRVPPIGTHTSDANRTYAIGDGAHLDNLGVLALLARKVPRIIVFVNTTDPIVIPRGDSDWASGDPARMRAYVRNNPREFLDDMRALFGFMATKRKVAVFAEQEFFDLYRELHRLKELKRDEGGEPLTVCKRMEVQPNSHFGVPRQCLEPTPECTAPAPMICWVYLDRFPDFVDAIGRSRLSVDTKHALSFGATPTPGFPHYRTAFGDSPQIVDLDENAIGALAHLTAWTLNRDCKISKAIFDYDACAEDR